MTMHMIRHVSTSYPQKRRYGQCARACASNRIGSEFFGKETIPRPVNELKAATLSLVLFEFKFYE
jgi:hypothetical protein